MVLTKKSLSELDKLIEDMSTDQMDALFSEIGAKVLPNATMEYLIETRDSINELINKAKEAENERFASEARVWAEKARQLGLNLPDILGITPPSRINRVRLNDGTPGERAAPKPKYSDGKGNFWTGRGIQPKWITLAIAEGRAKSKDEFLIKE